MCYVRIMFGEMHLINDASQKHDTSFILNKVFTSMALPGSAMLEADKSLLKIIKCCHNLADKSWRITGAAKRCQMFWGALGLV